MLIPKEILLTLQNISLQNILNVFLIISSLVYIIASFKFVGVCFISWNMNLPGHLHTNLKNKCRFCFFFIVLALFVRQGL